MKEKRLIKVVGTITTDTGNGRHQTQHGRGITQLKRGESLLDFITTFLSERQFVGYSLNKRGDKMWSTSPIMSGKIDQWNWSTGTEKAPMMTTFHFIEFPLSELGYYAKDLTALELERDVKQLRKLIYG